MRDDIEKIFTFYSDKSGIFARKDFLQSSYVPDKLPHREELVKQLAQMLAPSLRGEKPSNIFVYGKPGTGKTAAVTFVGSQLQSAAESKGIPVRFFYINSGLKKVADTEYRLYAHICRMLGEFIPDTGIPTNAVFERMAGLLDESPAVYMIVLDEVDVLVAKSPGVLYTLSRINSELKKSKVSLIGITNELNVMNGVDSRTKSSLSEEELVFTPYNANQLYEILKERSGGSFPRGVIEDSVLMLCSASAAKEHGDARRALELLRVSAELAERDASVKVTKEHVEKAIQKSQSDRVLSFVKMLPDHQKLVLRGLMEIDRPMAYTREVYEKYVEVASSLGLKGLTMRRVLDILGEFESAGIIDTKVISRGRYGRTKIVELQTVGNIKEQVEKFLVEV